MKIQTSVLVEDIFCKVAMKKCISFDLTLLSDELKNRLINIERNTNTQTYNTSDALFDDLEI